MRKLLEDLTAAGLLGFFIGIHATLFLGLDLSLLVFFTVVVIHAGSYLNGQRKLKKNEKVIKQCSLRHPTIN